MGVLFNFNHYFNFHREYLDDSDQNEFSDVVRNVHAIIDRHALPWDHEYIQCRLQNSLYAITNKLPYSSEICWEKIPEHIQNIEAIESDVNEPKRIKQQQNVDKNEDEDAFIRYSPPNNNYADEVYYPPMKREPNLM